MKVYGKTSMEILKFPKKEFKKHIAFYGGCTFCRYEKNHINEILIYSDDPLTEEEIKKEINCQKCLEQYEKYKKIYE